METNRETEVFKEIIRKLILEHAEGNLDEQKLKKDYEEVKRYYSVRKEKDAEKRDNS